MKKSRKILIYCLAIITIIGCVISYCNLLSPFNFVTARLDQLNGNLVYPQCEFKGKDSDKLNTAALALGFSTIYVDCELFYTNGMDSYYRIMNEEFTEKYGDNWIDKLYEQN